MYNYGDVINDSMSIRNTSMYFSHGLFEHDVYYNLWWDVYKGDTHIIGSTTQEATGKLLQQDSR